MTTPHETEDRATEVEDERVIPKRGMKFEAYVFYATASFFTACAVIYGFWTDVRDGVPEMGGLVALILTGLMLAMIGTFIWFSSRRLEQARPEDDRNAAVADGAGDVGFFSPASYWPIALAAAATMAAVAIALWLVWLLIIGFGFLFMAVCGWLFEYQRAHADH